MKTDTPYTCMHQEIDRFIQVQYSLAGIFEVKRYLTRIGLNLYCPHWFMQKMFANFQYNTDWFWKNVLFSLRMPSLMIVELPSINRWIYFVEYDPEFINVFEPSPVPIMASSTCLQQLCPRLFWCQSFSYSCCRIKFFQFSCQVIWGTISMVDAEKRLLAHALQDPENQHFVLLSERLIIFICSAPI